MAQTPDENGTGTRINRRRLLKAAGAGAAGLAVIPSTGSAHAVFYGCSQVCTHSPGTNRRAVVVTDEGECVCRELSPSNRNDPDSGHLPGDDIICYEIQEGEEAVVGLIYCQDDGDKKFIENDNKCADNKIDCGIDTCSPCPEGGFE